MAALVAHGALMASAFLLLMPAAALAARHKWLSGSADPDGGRVRGGWFRAHRIVQIIALAAATAAFVVIFEEFGWLPGGPGLEVFSAHRALGIITFFFAFVQAGLGAARPALDAVPSRVRVVWFFAHQCLGWCVILLGTATCYLGVGTISILGFPPSVLSAWLGPTVGVTATLLLAGVLLEARRLAHVKSGRFDPETHTLVAGCKAATAAAPAAA